MAWCSVKAEGKLYLYIYQRLTTAQLNCVELKTEGRTWRRSERVEMDLDLVVRDEEEEE